MPKRLAGFLALLESFAPCFLAKPEIREQLQEMHDLMVVRAEEESNSNYSAPEDDDEIATRASGFESLQKNFKKLAAVSIWSERQQQSLDGCASHFSFEAQSLREDLPWEPDEDSSGPSHSASAQISGDVNIGDLFRDL